MSPRFEWDLVSTAQTADDTLKQDRPTELDSSEGRDGLKLLDLGRPSDSNIPTSSPRL